MSSDRAAPSARQAGQT